MPKHQRLALPLVLAVAITTSVLLAVVLSSGGNLAREASPHRGPIFKRQNRSHDIPGQSIAASILSSLEPPPSFGFGDITLPTTTTTPSSTRVETISTSTSVPSTTSARIDPTPTTSAATSASASSTRKVPPSDAAVIALSRTSLSLPSTSTTTTTAVQTTASVNTNPIVNTHINFSLGTFTPTHNPSVTQSASDNDNPVSPEASNGSDSSNKSFMGNKGAVGATFTVVGLVGAGLVVCAVLFIRKRMQERNLNKADWGDVNDTASMTEFASASARIGGGTGTTFMPPSAALARQPPGHGQGSDPHEMDQDRPDSVLAMPPVMNYERPRDAPSSHDIVPVGPPQLRVPGNHNSFGSMMGLDPFAGAPMAQWQDAERDSSYGAGQAGRGAGVNALIGRGGGYSMQPYSGGMGVAIGSDEDEYGGANHGGGQQTTGYQYAYPSHAYGQQYNGNPQQGGYGNGY